MEDYLTERLHDVTLATVSKELGVLKSAYARAMRWEWVSTTPFRGIALNQEGEERVRWLTDDGGSATGRDRRAVAARVHPGGTRHRPAPEQSGGAPVVLVARAGHGPGGATSVGEGQEGDGDDSADHTGGDASFSDSGDRDRTCLRSRMARPTPWIRWGWPSFAPRNRRSCPA